MTAHDNSLDRLREAVAKNGNPFELRFAKDAWDDAALVGDVAAIHRRASTALERAATATIRDGRARALLILGEAGAGKTHLLARLRRATTGKAAFACASSPQAGSSEGARAESEVLAALVDAVTIDLRRPANGRTQLALIVDPLVATLAPAALGDDHGILSAYLTPEALDDRPSLVANVIERIAPAFARDVPECPVELARWLLAERVGVTRDLAAPDPWRVLRGLGALAARAGTALVLALDQTDAVVPVALARAITRLHAASGLVVVVTNLTNPWTVARETLVEPERQRIEEDRHVLTPPQPEEMLAFVEARLARVHAHAGIADDPTFPFDDEDLGAKEGQWLRDRCRELAARLEARLELKRPIEATPREGARPDGRLERLIEETLPRLPDGEAPLREAIALALRGAGNEVEGPLDAEGALDVIVRSGKRCIGIKVCDADRGAALARRLEQLLDEVDAGTVERAILVRTVEVPATWRACRKLVDDLDACGGETIVCSPRDRAALHALARLGSEARTLAAGAPIVTRLVPAGQRGVPGGGGRGAPRSGDARTRRTVRS